MSRQATLANLLLRIGAIGLLQSRHQPRLPVLAYHRILDDDARPGDLRDPELFSTTAHQFDRQMAYVARHFQSVTFSGIHHGNAMPRNPIVITFDDGFEDNYRLAFPILRKHGLNAVFFVTTDFIEHREPLWFDQAACRIMSSQLPEELQVGDQMLTTAGLDRHRLASRILSCLKTMPARERDQVMASLVSQTGGTNDGNTGDAMTWEQLKEMSRAGMEIGSHSCSHAVLANERRGRIFDELNESRQSIESNLDVPCISLAYPVGSGFAINDEVRDIASECGYHYACTYINGVNALPLDAKLNLSRQHVEMDVSVALFAAQLALPGIFGYSAP